MVQPRVTDDKQTSAAPPPTTLHDWYAVGQGMTVEVGGVTVAFRVVGHKGRRTRIVVTAPAGAVISGTGQVAPPSLDACKQP